MGSPRQTLRFVLKCGRQVQQRHQYRHILLHQALLFIIVVNALAYSLIMSSLISDQMPILSNFISIPPPIPQIGEKSQVTVHGSPNSQTLEEKLLILTSDCSVCSLKKLFFDIFCPCLLRYFFGSYCRNAEQPA